MKRKSKSAIIFVVVVVIIIVFLFLYPKIFDGGGGVSAKVPCLVPNLPLIQHIHPRLQILVDGENELIPNGIGLGACEKAIHTHNEGDGTIHVEAQDRRQYTLGDFFDVWGKPIEREGHKLETTVDGQVVQNPAGIILKDGQQIAMRYTKL